MFVFGVISIEVWDTQFPVWAFVLALVSKAQQFLFRLSTNSWEDCRFRVHNSHRHDPSYHKSTDWTEVSTAFCGFQPHGLIPTFRPVSSQN